ncbi:MAG: GMC family oxidoreductase [Solirubrobacteraceae bacterium]
MTADEHFDSVVIGSGFGGSVAAYRLAEAGRSVLVLERGQPYPPGSFPRTPNDLRTSFWDPSKGLYGLFDLWWFDQLDAVVASGLGGGSLIYANVMLRKDERTFVHEELADGGYESWPVTRAELEPHYDAVERMQKPQRFPIDAGPPYSTTRKTRALLQAASTMRLPASTPPLAVLFAPGAGQRPVPGLPLSDGSANLHGAPRSTCRLCGECDLGCNFGAKNTLDFTYLSRAMEASAQIRTCCEVGTISPAERRGGYRVGYRQHFGARGGHPERLLDPTREPQRTVTADQVVLAAGAVATPHLLLSNRAGLPRLSHALGSRVSGNGDYIGWIRDCRNPSGTGWRYLEPSRGPVITASIEVDEHSSPSGRGFLIQDAGAPNFADWLWQSTELPGDLIRMARPLRRLLRDRLRGRRDTEAAAVAAGLLGDAHASAAMLPVLAMGRDVPNGRYRLQGKRLELDWRPELSDPYYDGLRERMRELARSLGGRFMPNPLDRRGRSISVHMVGGCPMGTSSREGVVDPWGRVFGHPGLWIADGSVMPGPVGVNPSFTIAALADRFADAML